MLSKKVLSVIDINSTFKIQIPEGVFYVIKDFGDGNYLAMEENGAIYGMIHDPYEVEMLFKNKDVFVNAIESGEFNIFKYYNSKIS